MQVLSIGIHSIIYTTIGIFVIFLLIIALIFLYLTYKKILFREKERLKKIFYLLIEKTLFYDPLISIKTEGDTWMHIPLKFKALLKKKPARTFLIYEILQVQKNISGASRENLQKLYEQLGLRKDALRKLRRFSRWYKKAEGIQELSIMDQRDCLRAIYKYVNHKNEFIRMEAQSAAIHFLGFHGLRFLNIITYPLSEWQQLKLLEQLSHLPSQEFKEIDRWLRSPNDSVIVFALKLVRVYHRFEMHDIAGECLDHTDIEIRKNSIITLMQIYNEDTADLLIQHYEHEDKDCRLAILNALSEIRDPDTIPFLTAQLLDKNNELKFAAARAIMATAGRDGIDILQSCPYAGDYPWKDIIRQMNEEVTA